MTAYETVKSSALDWILANTAETFNWQGEFQDVAPNAPYENTTHHAACQLAGYLFEHLEEHPERRALAEDIDNGWINCTQNVANVLYDSLGQY